MRLALGVTSESLSSWVALALLRYFDISAARAELGYSPIIGFEQGWKDVVAAQCAQRGVFSGGGWAIFEQKQKEL